jgi:ABC-type Fe3+ transport system substrate-binding protein
MAAGMETIVGRLQQEEQSPLPMNIDAVPDLVITHQISIMKNRDSMIKSGNYECLQELFPEMRSDLKQLGFDDPTGYFKVICVVPLVFIYRRSLENPPKSWADLTSERWQGRIAASSPDILVKLLRFYAKSILGEEAHRLIANVVFDGIPIDTNLKVDRGEIDIGIVPLPFTRASREKNISMCWPEEGAINLPQVIIHKSGSFIKTYKISEFLLSEEVQRYISETGMIIPVHPDVPLPPEVEENGLNLYWKGWDWFLNGLNDIG